MNVLIRILQGAVAFLIYYSILVCIKKYDPGHGLPKKMTWRAFIFPSVGGICLATGSLVQTILLVLCIGYLSAMAYTDYYSKRVYSFFYIVTAIPGYIWMMTNGTWSTIAALLVFILFEVLCAFLFGGFRDGDVEVFIALAPYLTLLACRIQINVLLFLNLFLIISMLFAVIGCLILSIKERRLIRKNAMVPFIYGALICMILIDNIL